ncbi:hypothetical protein JCM10207_000697 [Rhodosporidiobolus poonsookiae]
MDSVASAPPPQLAQPDDERRSTAIYGCPATGSVGPKIFREVYDGLGLPQHSYVAVDCESLKGDWEDAVARPDYLGSCITIPHKLEAYTKVDYLTPEAKACGCVNTMYLRPSSSAPSSGPLPGLLHVGTNTDVTAVHNVLLSSLLSTPSPFPSDAPRSFAPGKAAGFVIGGGGAVRAAVYALSTLLNSSPIFILNRDPAETQAVVQHFPGVDLRPLTSIEQTAQELEVLRASGVSLVGGVGCVPSYEPKTDGEKRVYELAELLFSEAYERPAGEEKGYLTIPQQPVFLDMAYKPRMTLLRVLAEKHSWTTVCGTEAVLENAFEQGKLWTGIDVPADVRTRARNILEE